MLLSMPAPGRLSREDHNQHGLHNDTLSPPTKTELRERREVGKRGEMEESEALQVLREGTTAGQKHLPAIPPRN